MASILRGRRPLRSACAAVALITLTAVIVGVPATQAKNKGAKGHARHAQQTQGQGKSRSKGPQAHKNSAQPRKHDHGQQHGKSKQPQATPATSNPTPTPAKPAPAKPSPGKPKQTRPAPTSPIRSPVAHRRRAATRRARHRASSPRAAIRGASTRRTSAATGATPAAATSTASSEDAKSSRHGAPKRRKDQGGSPVTRTVRQIVNVVPSSVKAILAALAALTVLLAAGSLFSTLRARRLDRQRRELLQEVGLLQSALLPPVPPTVGALRTSVAYMPAEGAAAGGDFYDALSLPDGKAAFILGDVSGHGRDALERTAFLRYTLRAYLEAGLAPRAALQIAGRVIEGQLGGDFATVVLAVHDPATGSLTYASAGHPAPLVIGPSAYEPVLAASSPPLGVGLRTGLRQTTVPLAPGCVACLYTDGLTEARTADGILGRIPLTDFIAELGREGTAPQLLDRVAEEASAVPDDMAACLFTPTAGVTTGGFRTEVLELSASELDGALGRRFLEACGVGEEELERALEDAAFLATRFDQVILHVVFGNRLTVEALPANVESIEVAARRALAG